MRRFFPLAFLVGTLSCSATEPVFQTCIVRAVYDGDTMDAICTGSERRIRLSSVDAPESKQRFGPEAQQFTEGATLNRPVRVYPEDWDKYGRVVARVQLPDGRDLGRDLVKAGLAWHYVRYSRDPDLAEIEKTARAGRRGLWADPLPEPPSAWRKAKREGTFKRGPRRSEPRSARRSLPRRHA